MNMLSKQYAPAFAILPTPSKICNSRMNQFSFKTLFTRKKMESSVWNGSTGNGTVPFFSSKLDTALNGSWGNYSTGGIKYVINHRQPVLFRIWGAL